MSISADVGDRIALLLRSKGKTQEDLATSIGVRRETISRKMKGDKAGFSLSELEAIARFLNVGLGYLTTGDQENGLDLSSGAQRVAVYYDKLEQEGKDMVLFLIMDLISIQGGCNNGKAQRRRDFV